MDVTQCPSPGSPGHHSTQESMEEDNSDSTAPATKPVLRPKNGEPSRDARNNERFLHFLTVTSKLLTIFYQLVPIILVIIILVVHFFKRNETLVLLETFDVHLRSEAAGFNGGSLANKLLDQINLMREKTPRVSKGIDYIPLSQMDQVDWEIEVGGVSAKSFSRYIRERLGPNVRRVLGETVIENDHAFVTVRIPGQSSRTFEGKTKNLDRVMRQAAGYVLLAFDPYVLAVNLLGVDQAACLETIKHILKNDPRSDDASAYDLWGRLLADQGNYKAAHAKYENAIKLDSNSAEIYSNWGAVYYKEKNYKAAHAKYEIAKRLNPRLAPVYFNEGLTFAEEGKHTEEIRAYQKATTLDPLLRDAYFSWAFALRDLGKREDEITMLEKTIELDPRYSDAYIELGFTLREQQKYPAAAEKLEKAIEIDPKSVRGHYYLGLVYERLEKYDKAIGAFEQVIILDPSGSFARGLKEYIARLREKLHASSGISDSKKAARQKSIKPKF